MRGSPRTGVLDGVLEQRLDLARAHVGAQPGAQVDRGGLAQRHDGGAEHDVVRDHDRVLALREGRVEQAERGDDALDLAGHGAGLQPHAVADPERARGDQDHAGDQVAERLLGRETDDDGGDRASDGQRGRVQPADAQRQQHGGRDHAPAGSGTPTVPAVAGSMRRNSAGAAKRPRSRASSQPRPTIATAAPTRTGVSAPRRTAPRGGRRRTP